MPLLLMLQAFPFLLASAASPVKVERFFYGSRPSFRRSKIAPPRPMSSHDFGALSEAHEPTRPACRCVLDRCSRSAR